MYNFFNAINKILAKINRTKPSSYIEGCKEHWDELKNINTDENNILNLTKVFQAFVCMSVFKVLIKGTFYLDGHYRSLNLDINRYDSDYVEINTALSNEVYIMPDAKFACGDGIGVVEDGPFPSITFRLLKIKEFDEYHNDAICNVLGRKTINVFDFIQDNSLIDKETNWNIGDICYCEPYITILLSAEIVDIDKGVLTVMYGDKSIKKWKNTEVFKNKLDAVLYWYVLGPIFGEKLKMNTETKYSYAVESPSLLKND